MTTAISKNVVERFGELMREGLSRIKEACEIYVEAIKDPLNIEKFQEAYPEIPASAWARFEAVGRGTLHVKLLTDFRCKKLEKCPYSEQQKYLEHPIDVFLPSGDKVKIALQNLTPEQSAQVFAKDHVRTLAEQKAYIESLKTKTYIAAKVKAHEEPYRIVRKQLVVGNIIFTRKDLLRILSEMEK